MQTYRPYKSYSYQRVQKAQPRRQPSRRRPAVILGAGALFFAIIINLIVVSGDKNQPAGQAVLAQASKKEEKAPLKTVDTTGLQERLDAITKKYNYDTGVVVVELNSGKQIQSGENAAFIAASTTKLLSAVYYLHEVENGQASLNQQIDGKPAEEQLRLMVNESDNAAWHSINNFLDRSKMESFAKSKGLTSYNPTENKITPSDMASLTSKIYKKKLINSEHTELLLSWMQKTSEEQFIPPAVPATVKLYHKAGYLPDRAHDAAIIDNGSTPFVLVIFSKSYTNIYDYQSGQKLFKEVTTEVLNVFNG